MGLNILGTIRGYDSGMKHASPPSVTALPPPAIIAQLRPRDVVRIDPDPLIRLHSALGAQGAEDMIGRALEDISHRLTRIEADHRACAFDRLGRGAKAIGAVAAQVGLRDLGAVATHVVECCGHNDAAALGATVARLMRMGTRAMAEMGQMRFTGL